MAVLQQENRTLKRKLEQVTTSLERRDAEHNQCKQDFYNTLKECNHGWSVVFDRVLDENMQLRKRLNRRRVSQDYLRVVLDTLDNEQQRSVAFRRSQRRSVSPDSTASVD